MSNKLKGIFSTEEPQFKGNLKFKNHEHYTNFIEAMKTAIQQERFVAVQGLDSMETYLDDGTQQLIINQSNNISEFFIGPSIEKFPYQLVTDYGQFEIQFDRIIKEDTLVIKNDENSIVHIRLEFDVDNDVFHYTYKVNPHKANSIESIYKTYNAAWKFLDEIMEQSSDDVNEAINALKSLEQFWLRAHKLEKFLEVQFDLSRVEGRIEDEVDIEKLYLLLIKKHPIRKNLNDLNYSFKYDEQVSLDKLKIGRQMLLTFNEEYRYNIWGAEFPIYISNYIFNAFINSIEKSAENGECIVHCLGNDRKPLYSVYRGFKTKEEAKAAIENGGKRASEYEGAKTFNQLISETQ